MWKLHLIPAPCMSIAFNVFFLSNGKIPTSKPGFPTPGFCLSSQGDHGWNEEGFDNRDWEGPVHRKMPAPTTGDADCCEVGRFPGHTAS